MTAQASPAVDLMYRDVTAGEIVTASEFGRETFARGWWADFPSPAWHFARVVALYPRRPDLIGLQLRSGRIAAMHRRYWMPYTGPTLCAMGFWHTEAEYKAAKR